jgi:hypothetical protein
VSARLRSIPAGLWLDGTPLSIKLYGVIAHGRLRSVGLRRLGRNLEEALQLAVRAPLWQLGSSGDQRSAMVCYLVCPRLLSFLPVLFGPDSRCCLDAAGSWLASSMNPAFYFGTRPFFIRKNWSFSHFRPKPGPKNGTRNGRRNIKHSTVNDVLFLREFGPCLVPKMGPFSGRVLEPWVRLSQLCACAAMQRLFRLWFVCQLCFP